MLRLRPMSAIETHAVSDEQLARSLGTGDAAAFDELYRRYAGLLTSYATRLLGDAAAGEDVAQITLLNAYQALRRGSQPLYVRAWLYRIAQNTAVEILSRRREHVEFADEHHRAQDPQEVSATRGALVAALGTLPERQRRAYLLREVRGLRVSEIGNALSLSAVQVEQALFAARNRLAEHLTFGDDLDCATARGLSAETARHAERRALKRHMRSCRACRSAAPRRSLRVGLFGPLSALRDVAVWLAGSGTATAPVRLGAMAAAAFAVGTPVLAGDASPKDLSPPRAPTPVVVPSPAASDEAPVLLASVAQRTALPLGRAPAAWSPAQGDDPAPTVAAAAAAPEADTPAADEEPAAGEVAAEEAPVAEESPIAEGPLKDDPVVEEPVAAEPVEEGSAAEGPGAEGPAAEGPAEEEPVAEEPAAEEPASEEPMDEEPAAEEPVAEGVEEDFPDGGLVPTEETDAIPDESSQGDLSSEPESPRDQGTQPISVADATALALEPETVAAVTPIASD